MGYVLGVVYALLLVYLLHKRNKLTPILNDIDQCTEKTEKVLKETYAKTQETFEKDWARVKEVREEYLKKPDWSGPLTVHHESE